MSAFVAAGAGFMLAVLWFDLMFDVQVLRRRESRHAEDAVASIAAYYARVTTGAHPMHLLVAAVMVATLAAIGVQIASADDPTWLGWTSLALAGTAIALAALHTFPTAVRIGSGTGTADERLGWAREVARDHLLCITAIVLVLAIQLAFG